MLSVGVKWIEGKSAGEAAAWGLCMQQWQWPPPHRTRFYTGDLPFRGILAFGDSE